MLLRGNIFDALADFFPIGIDIFYYLILCLATRDYLWMASGVEVRCLYLSLMNQWSSISAIALVQAPWSHELVPLFISLLVLWNWGDDDSILY
jgi:hypothetical protein